MAANKQSTETKRPDLERSAAPIDTVTERHVHAGVVPIERDVE